VTWKSKRRTSDWFEVEPAREELRRGDMEIQTENLRLVLQTPEETLAAVEALSPADRAQVSPDWLARVRALTGPDPWTLCFAVVHRASAAVIGSCGYKGPSDSDGVVEISYGTDPDHRGKGFATEVAEALVTYAFGDSRVRVPVPTVRESERLDTGLDQMRLPLHRRGHRPRRRIGMAIGEKPRRGCRTKPFRLNPAV